MYVVYTIQWRPLDTLSTHTKPKTENRDKREAKVDDGWMVRRAMRMGRDEGMKEKSVGKGDGMGDEGEVRQRKQWWRLGGRLYIHTERESRQIRIKKKRICMKWVGG